MSFIKWVVCSDFILVLLINVFAFVHLIFIRLHCSNRQDILGQYSMVNLELFNIVDEIRKVSKAFVVHPKNVNAENSTSKPSTPRT